MASAFRSLSSLNYRRFFIGSLATNVGIWMQRVTQDWLVLQISGGSALAMGITISLQFVPMLSLSALGGVLADRYSKHKLLMWSQSLMAFSALGLAVLVATGHVHLYHVFAQALVLGLANAVDNPTRQAFVIEMVGHEKLTNAIALNAATMNMSRIAGPATAGLIIATAGTQAVLFVNGGLFLFAIAMLLSLRRQELSSPEGVKRSRGQLREAVRYLRTRQDLVTVLTIAMFLGTFGLNFSMMTALMATEVFGKGAGEFGALTSVMAVGALAGSLYVARLDRPRVRRLVIAVLCFAVTEVTIATAPTYWLFMIGLVPIGFFSIVFMASSQAMMQIAVPPQLRGRLASIYAMCFMGGTVFGSPLIGGIAQTFGPRWGLITGGVVTAVAAIVAALRLIRMDRLAVHLKVRPRPHMVIDRPPDPVTTPASPSVPADSAAAGCAARAG